VVRRAIPSWWFCLATLSVLTTADAPAVAQRVLLSASRDDVPASTSLIDLATGVATPFSTDFTETSMVTSDGAFVLRLTSADTRWRVRDMTSGVEVLLPFDFTPVAPHPRQQAVFGFAPNAVPARLDSSGLARWPVCGAATASTMRVGLDGLRLYVLCNHQIVVVDTASGVPVRTLTVGDPVEVFGFVLGRDDTTVLVLRVRNDVRELARIDADTGATIETAPYAGPPLLGSTAARDAFIGSQCRIVGPNVFCALVVTDVDTLAEVRRFGTFASVNRFWVSPDNQHAYLNSFETSLSRAMRLDFHTGAIIDGPIDLFRGRLSMGVAFPPLAPQLDPPQLMGRSASLAWTLPAPSPDVTGYLLEVGSQPGAADLAAVALGRLPAFAGSGVPPGRYFVRVRAVNANGTSAPSNEVVIDVP
jgi:hypothetical protein